MTTENKKPFAELKPFRRAGERIVAADQSDFCWLPGDDSAAAAAFSKQILALLRRANAGGLVELKIKLLPSELLSLEAKAKRCDVTAADILEQFVADLAGSSRTSGSDDRDMAEQYFRRTNLAAPIWMRELDGKSSDPAVEARFAQAAGLEDAAYSINRRGY